MPPPPLLLPSVHNVVERGCGVVSAESAVGAVGAVATRSIVHSVVVAL